MNKEKFMETDINFDKFVGQHYANVDAVKKGYFTMIKNIAEYNNRCRIYGMEKRTLDEKEIIAGIVEYNTGGKLATMADMVARRLEASMAWTLDSE